MTVVIPQSPSWEFALSLIVSFFLPLLTAVFINMKMPRDVKGVVLLVLTAATSIGTQLAEDKSNWEHIVIVTLINLAVAIGAYFGIWKQGALHAKLYAFPRKGWASVKAPRKAA